MIKLSSSQHPGLQALNGPSRKSCSMLVLAMCLAGLSGSAQPVKVTSAYNYLKNGQYAEAKETIEVAAEHEKTGTWAKTWYYRGMIYENIYFSEDPKFKDIHDIALIEAFKSYRQTYTIGVKKIDAKDLKRRYSRLGGVFFEEGVRSFNGKLFSKAIEQFERCLVIRDHEGTVDSVATYNLARAAEQVDDYDRAFAKFRKCIALKYNEEFCYIYMVNMQSRRGDDNATEDMLREARQAFPNNQQLLTMEINLYLKRGKLDEAQENLNVAIEQDPENAMLYYARGTIFNSREMLEKAETDYWQAIDLDSLYFDAYYNLGALYYNQGADLYNDAHELPIAQMVKVDRMTKQANAFFEKSLPLLEEAHRLNPVDQPTMVSLQRLYLRTKRMEQYEAISDKLNN